MTGKGRLIKFGDNLKKVRESRNLTLRGVSQLCSIDWSDIGKIERGEINITLETLFEIADALEIAASDLLKFD